MEIGHLVVVGKIEVRIHLSQYLSREHRVVAFEVKGGGHRGILDFRPRIVYRGPKGEVCRADLNMLRNDFGLLSRQEYGAVESRGQIDLGQVERNGFSAVPDDVAIGFGSDLRGDDMRDFSLKQIENFGGAKS